MPDIIKDNAIIHSPWRIVDKGSASLEGSHLLLPLADYLELHEHFASRDDVGVWLDADEEAEALADHVDELPVIGLNFPTFFDGRSLSNANIIRRRLGFRGELRAIGDVRRDQLDQMHRCGINAFQLTEGQDIEIAVVSLDAFTFNYQGSIVRPQPLFRSHRPGQTDTP